MVLVRGPDSIHVLISRHCDSDGSRDVLPSVGLNFVCFAIRTDLTLLYYLRVPADFDFLREKRGSAGFSQRKEGVALAVLEFHRVVCRSPTQL